MRTHITIFLFCLSLLTRAQVTFRTIVPQQPVTDGESFQVQYIIEEADDISNLIAPVFTNFRLVTGPNVYHGKTNLLGRTRDLHNTVFTLEATKTGKFRIPGAVATVNGEMVRSPDQQVIVISAGEAMQRYERAQGINDDYVLRPGEDPYSKINKNLFLKVMVDKQSVYTGEPVVATFKLYSRLESKSDIVKNPGFYGFTVHDVINLADRFVTTENIGGRAFDVHTIRKVELFPLQAGTYTIDPMEIRNTVKFSKSAVYRKTEQEIVEGVNIQTSGPDAENTTVFETDMHTEPVTIHVKPVPDAGRPAGYAGAVGNFSLQLSLKDNSLAKNQEGALEMHISGSGNLIQLNAPVINWPEGVEGFEPVLISKSETQGAASKTFRYAFVSPRPGHYQIPSVSFSFFNPDSGRFKTVRTDAMEVSVSNTELPVKRVVDATFASGKKQNRFLLLAICISILAAAVYFIFRRAKRKPVVPQPVILTPEENTNRLLQNAKMLIDGNDKAFFTALRGGLYDFFRESEGLRGSELTKDHLSSLLRRKGIAEELVTELSKILAICEAGMYTDAVLGVDNAVTFQRAYYLLVKLEGRK